MFVFLSLYLICHIKAEQISLTFFERFIALNQNYTGHPYTGRVVSNLARDKRGRNTRSRIYNLFSLSLPEEQNTAIVKLGAQKARLRSTQRRY